MPDAGLDLIRTRRSVRQFTAEPVPQKDVDAILECAMLAPSAVNEQPWEFVVITDQAILNRIPSLNKYASFANKAPLSILVCLNEKDEKEKGMGIVDVSMCSENILLACHVLGYGAVFTGIYPIEERIRDFSQLASLPDYVIPIGLIVIGKPKNPLNSNVPERVNHTKIHFQTWRENKHE